MGETKRRIITFKIVIPFRDYKRIIEIISYLKSLGCTPIYIKRSVLFKERRELDPVEIVYKLELPSEKIKELKKKTAKVLRGTLGFFLLYPS